MRSNSLRAGLDPVNLGRDAPLLSRRIVLLFVGGAILLLLAVLTWRESRKVASAAMMAWLITLAWSLKEVGLDPWGLEVRLVGPSLLLVLLVLISPVTRAVRIAVTALSAGSLLAGFALVAVVNAPPGASARFSFALAAPVNWPSYGGNSANTHFTSARQVNVDNVAALKIAWTYQLGTASLAGRPGAKYAFQATPLKISDTLYVCAPNSVVVALDADTGRPRWRFDPHADLRGGGLVCRGVSYAKMDNTGPCARRILAPTIDARLMALDADTGRPCLDFGTQGFVSLLDGIGSVRPGFAYTTSPGVVIDGRIVLGGQVADAKSVDVPSGVIRAYDVRTGHLAWAWDMGRPERSGAPAPGETYTRGTPNAWAPLAADSRLGLVYVPTGNPSPDFLGGGRRSFDEAYGSAVVALDARTGRPRWRFQTVHHDLWDADLPAQSLLINWPVPGGSVPALVQPTKTGNIYVLDRRNGRPLPGC